MNIAKKKTFVNEENGKIRNISVRVQKLLFSIFIGGKELHVSEKLAKLCTNIMFRLAVGKLKLGARYCKT